ncbi:MAG: MAPEG family protein [Pseudomonadota bacterium]
MIAWILVALGLYFVQTLLPVTFRYRGQPDSMLSRDVMPEATPLVLRSERALVNVGEAMMVFLPLAILTKDIPAALLGAQIFVFARIVYVPLYLFGIPYLRTVVWIVSLVGLGVMAAQLM